MMHQAPYPHELDEIRELNHLFLIMLQQLAQTQAQTQSRAQCLGLDTSIARRLRSAAPAVLLGMAAYPRALFSLNLNPPESPGSDFEATGDALERARLALTLTLALTAWNMSRQRGFQARMFLGLTAAEVRRLRAMPLLEVQRLGARPGLVSCAFPGATSIWATLLRHAARGLPPALRLVGLQPHLPIEPVSVPRKGPSAGTLTR